MIFPKYRDKEGVSHMVQEQLEEVRQNIRNACERSGRKVENIVEDYDRRLRTFG